MTKHRRTLPAAILIALAACSPAEQEPAPLSGDWEVDSEASRLSYVTVKAGEIAETNEFTKLSGSVSATGEAQLEIDLASVSTGIDIRDERMREVFFNVAQFPTASVTAEIDPAAFEQLGLGQTTLQPLSATLSVSGAETTVDTEVAVTRIADNRVLVTSTDPVLVTARSLELEEGLAKLQELAGLPSITPVVPVTFSLTFER